MTTSPIPAAATNGRAPEEFTLARSLFAACARFADRPAIGSARGTLTYGRLGTSARALAAALAARGIRPGDRVVCSVSNRPEHLVALLAAWELGAVHVGVDYQLTLPELDTVVEQVGASALIYEPPREAADPLALPRALTAARPQLEVVVVGDAGGAELAGFDELVEAGEHRRMRTAPASDDPAVIFISSGTTGRPKATVGYQGNLGGRWTRLGGWLGFGPEDTHLAQLPLSHGFGLMMAVAALLSGGRLILLKRFAVCEALDAIGRERVTVVNGAPAHFRLLLDRLDDVRHDVGSLRLSVGTAAIFPAPLVRAIWDRLGARFMFMYGSSEGVGFATTDPDDILRGSVGRVAAGSVRVVDDRRRTLAPGEVGELAFSRAEFPVRYWDREEDGELWYYSGDRGTVDEEGRLFVYGRLKHQIDRGGLKVDPVEVEAALLDSPRIADGTVIGMPDEVLGEIVCACAVMTGEQPQPRLEEVRHWMGRSLAPHKLPDELRSLPSIPRTAVGKVDLEGLRRVIDTTPHIVERRTQRGRSDG